jgi:uncharacterized protein YbjQ (UPF0145 family)
MAWQTFASTELRLVMQISFSASVEGGRVIQSFGRLRAATAWHAPGAKCARGDWKAEALRALVGAAEDFEADALIEVAYDVDGVTASDLCAFQLQRVIATGTVVRLARA